MHGARSNNENNDQVKNHPVPWQNKAYSRMFLKVWPKPGITGQVHVPPVPTAL